MRELGRDEVDLLWTIDRSEVHHHTYVVSLEDANEDETGSCPQACSNASRIRTGRMCSSTPGDAADSCATAVGDCSGK